MNREYLEDKVVTLKKVTGNQRLLEVIGLLMILVACYLFLSLLTFDKADSGWSQTTGSSVVLNMGGRLGAVIADVLFLMFGAVAFLLPFMLFLASYNLFKQRNAFIEPDYFLLSLKIIGFVVIIIGSCTLADINFDDLHNFSSGGALGHFISNRIEPLLNLTGATLTFLGIWAIGVSLFTGWSWLTIIEKIGAIVTNTITFLFNLVRRQSQHSQFEDNSKYAGEVPPTQYQMPIKTDPVNADDALFSSTSILDYQGDPKNGTAQQTTTYSSLSQQGFVTTSYHGCRHALEGSEDTTSAYTDDTMYAEPFIRRDPTFYTQSDTSSTRDNNEMFESVQQARLRNDVLIAEEEQRDTTTTELNRIPSSTNQTALNYKKQDLPRPNKVRIPTRRELVTSSLLHSRYDRSNNREDKMTENELYRESEHVNYDPQYEPSAEESHTFHEVPVAEYPQHENRVVKAETLHIELSVPVTPPVRPLSTNRESEYEDQQSDSFISYEEESYHEEIKNKEETSKNALSKAMEEDLIHPFLMRNEKPAHKPTTPLPTLELLTRPPLVTRPVDQMELETTARLIEDSLSDYRVKASVVGILPGPVVTLYELDLAPGVKAARISNLSRDLARSLSAIAVRVVEVIPERPYVGLELPNKNRQTVYLREVLDCHKFREMNSPLAIVLGKDIAGQPVVADLAKMPHVLVAGTTGSGKSVGVNAMIISMLYKATPDEVRFIMIDPKMLELSVYEGIPHLLTEVVTDMKDAANALRWCVAEMERRYKLMSVLGVRNLSGYNERIQQAQDMGRPVPDPFWKPNSSMATESPMLEKLPYIVVIVDEFADLMMAVGKKVEELIARLAQKARAAGIHLVLATQRPSVDVITGLIKANIPTRIAFTVSSKIDSRTILDQGGADSLLGMGDMLYLPPNSSSTMRVHGAFVRDEEVHAVVQDWKARGKPQYIDSITKNAEEGETGSNVNIEELDPLFDQAVAFVVEKRKPSISGVQRQFRIGYNRAARIIEQMEEQGILGAPNSNGVREVLAPTPYE